MPPSSSLKWSKVKIGIVVVLALAMLIVMIMNLEEGMGLVSRQTRFRAVVDHTQGLKVGGPVRLNGVDVGNVREIGIAKDDARVEILFSVATHVAPHIRADASVSIRPLGLLGDKFLDILPGTSSQPSMSQGGVLIGKAEPDVSGLASDASATMGNVNAALQDIQRLLAGLNQGQGTAGKLMTDPGLYDRSQRVLEKLDAASDKSIALLSKVERGEGTIGQLVTDKEVYARVNRALKDLSDLTSRLNNQNGTLVKLADPTLYGRLDSLTTRGELLLNKVEHGDGTIGKLVNRDELYTRVDKLLTEVEDLVADVKKHPTKYFKFSVF
ncbi:MAG TPA: MlaD family protein [Nitrospiraceae bacterium]|nr:MlaD family protein [Nitrospiraceae bacterium]